MKAAIIFILFALLLPEAVYSQYRSEGKTMQMGGLQLKTFDLAPVELAYAGFTKYLVWMVRGGIGIDGYGSFSSNNRSNNVNNKAFTMTCDFTSVHIRPGVGIRLINNRKATSCLLFNYPMGWNFYTLIIKSEDSLLGTYEKTQTSTKLQSAIEFEYYSSFHLIGAFSITSGLALGFKQSQKNPFINEYPGISGMFNYTPGIGFGDYKYFNMSIGMSYLFN